MAKRNSKKERSSSKWCPCGYKRHGKNHDEGEHHKKMFKKEK